MSVEPRSEKFNIVSNDHGRKQKCDFCIPVRKTNFTDHRRPAGSWNTINSFRDLVLVSKMHDCMICKISEHYGISIPSHQAMEAFTMNALEENKLLQNAFKRV